VPERVGLARAGAGGGVDRGHGAISLPSPSASMSIPISVGARFGAAGACDVIGGREPRSRSDIGLTSLSFGGVLQARWTRHRQEDVTNVCRRSTRHFISLFRAALVVFFQCTCASVAAKAEHKMTAEQAIGELSTAGFALVERQEFLPWQHILIFAPRR
jgi:hypothetical protein